MHYDNSNLYSALPARIIDDCLVQAFGWGDFSTFSKLHARIKSVVVSLGFFPLCLGADLVSSVAKSLFWRALPVFSLEPVALDRLNLEIDKCNDALIKSLKGLATFPMGLLWRDIVSNHFLSDRKNDGKLYPTGGLYSSAAEVRSPSSMEEVQEIIRDAKLKGKKVSIGGAGFSQGKHILPPNKTDFHIDMKKINHIRIEPKKKIAIVGGGATWQSLQEEANKHSLAISAMQASNVFSIAGSLSANCHGWDHTIGTLGNTVRSITIIDAAGEKQILTPRDKLFGYVLGGYGLFGVIIEAELDLTANEELFQYSEKVELKDYANYFDRKIQSNPHLRMHLYRLSLEPGKLLQEGYAQSYTVKDREASSENLVQEPVKGTSMDKILMQIARNSQSARNYWWKRELSNLLKVSHARRNDIMRPSILAAFANNSKAHTEWLQEYFVPKDKLHEFLDFLSKLLNKNDVALLNCSVRFVKKETRSKLGYAVDGDRFGVVLFFTQSLNETEVLKTKAWVQSVVDRLTKIGGTFYLPYVHFATREQFRKCYPVWQDINEKKHEYDPENRFVNGWYQDYFAGEL